ncbi:type VI secretion system accessory protein TagJ [Achromobacter arsenitoxydans]|uniref:Virulence protein SciE type n=1 Tax=Achromobacter arsenitoxydans SY8 TaxID=477184 RepID=H0FER5_9BURK|nr:type VI secretion system accessory protein TagJ [Achromobacter arsenitoxydans]EHK63216.1 virulence protein SciE type [Achromobacter arsenitoxydans SY8]
MPPIDDQIAKPRDSLRHLLGGRTLAAAIDDAAIQLRKQPAHVSLRWLLFQLLCLEGDWPRALKQLQVWASLDTDHLREAQMLRELLRAESYRAEVMKGRKQPGWLDEPPAWTSLLSQAAAALAGAHPEYADDLRRRALDNAPDAPGHANPGTGFSWISDSDTRLGPICELMFSGGYRWVPFACIASLSFPPVARALDLIWRPCKVTLHDNTVLSTYMPSRYPLIQGETDAQKLGAVTVWHDRSETTVTGVGQRTWITDSGEIGMLNVLSMHFEGQSIEVA